MSRFDICKFSPSPDQELVCGICMHILDMPKESPCRHVFCKVCIGQALQEKSKCPVCRTPFRESELKDVLPLVQNMLNKLTMFCDNNDNGCKELIPMERFINHVASCGYVFMTCKFSKCGLSVLKLNQENHETMECIYRDVVCKKGCGLSVTWKNRDNHNCMEALMSLKDDLINTNKLLESKIGDLNSIILGLNNTLHEFESKNLNSKKQKTCGNSEEHLENPAYSVEDVGSPIHSVSSVNSNLYDDYDDYHSGSISGISYYDDPVDPPDFIDFLDSNAGSSNERSVRFDVRYASDNVDEFHERENDTERIEANIEASIANAQLHGSDDDVYRCDDSEIAAPEPVEMNEIANGEFEHSISVSVNIPYSTESAGDIERDLVNSRKRSHNLDVTPNKRQRIQFGDDDSDSDVENDSSVRRSRRLQNINPSPTTEIPYVDVPLSTSYLLETYANETDSSDDDSWSPQ